MKAKLIAFIKTNPTVGITILTAYSYFCAYNYEVGYCTYYNIPNIYIDISINDIIKFSSAVLLASFFLVFYLYDFFQGEQRFFDNPILWKGIGEILFVAVIIGFWGIDRVITLPITFYYYFAAGVALLCILYVIRFYLFIKPRHLQLEKVSGDTLQVELQPETHPKFYVVIILFLIPFYCLFLGFGEASKVENFYVLSNTNNVVIKRYGDNIICKDYLIKKQRFGDSLILFKVSPVNQLHTFKKKLVHQLRLL